MKKILTLLFLALISHSFANSKYFYDSSDLHLFEDERLLLNNFHFEFDSATEEVTLSLSPQQAVIFFKDASSMDSLLDLNIKLWRAPTIKVICKEAGLSSELIPFSLNFIGQDDQPFTIQARELLCKNDRILLFPENAKDPALVIGLWFRFFSNNEKLPENSYFFQLGQENKKYAENIEIKSYLLAESQIPLFFTNNQEPPEQLPIDDLLQHDRYLVIAIKNKGDCNIEGTLKTETEWGLVPDGYISINLPSEMEDSHYYILPINELFSFEYYFRFYAHPQINLSFDKLYIFPSDTEEEGSYYLQTRM